MLHKEAFKSNTELIETFGEGNAYLVWAMSLYLDNPDPIQLGSESLTDGTDDKKIDFIRLDKDAGKIVFSQGYYSTTRKRKDSAPANKASDLNTAVAWLFSGSIRKIPEPLKSIVVDCREAIKNGEIEQIDLLYVHNLPESVSVSAELATVATHLSTSIPTDLNITVIYKELGIQKIEELYMDMESSIEVKEKIDCPTPVEYEETGPKWKAYILSIPGTWLRELFLKEGERLFSANYRGFLGSSKRRKINSGIRNTAEKTPNNFWVYNNGITILTTRLDKDRTKCTLNGMSIINGAQTTGSLGSLDAKIDLTNVKVLARIIECSDKETIAEIVKYNNTQNKITTWDRFSNSPEQKRIQDEFKTLGHSYSLKRGFGAASQIGIENVIQPSIAFEGYYVEANGGKNGVFESDKMYRIAFEDKKARHLLFTFCISRAIDERRIELRNQKTQKGVLIAIEEKQLLLLRNLRFKYFFMSVVGKCMDVILGKSTDLSQVGFSPDYAKASNRTINDLIGELLPLIKLILTYTSSAISNKDLSDIFKEDDGLNTISESVSALIYAAIVSGDNPIITNVRKMLSE